MKKILVAEDELRIRTLYEEVLFDMGYLVRTARNGREAWESFKKDRPDLVILDIKMPEMHGFEVLERIRELDPDVPILICSAYPRLRRDPSVMTMNVYDFIDKPIDIDMLRTKVKEALSYRSGGIAAGASERGRNVPK